MFAREVIDVRFYMITCVSKLTKNTRACLFFHLFFLHFTWMRFRYFVSYDSDFRVNGSEPVLLTHLCWVNLFWLWQMWILFGKSSSQVKRKTEFLPIISLSLVYITSGPTGNCYLSSWHSNNGPTISLPTN